MSHKQTQWSWYAAAVVMIGVLGGCHDDNSSAAPTPPPSSSTVNFSTFATSTFKDSAYTTPVNFDQLTLVYDVNNDPTAFDALLM